MSPPPPTSKNVAALRNVVSRRIAGWLVIVGSVLFLTSVFRPWYENTGARVALGLFGYVIALLLGLLILAFGVRVLSRAMTAMSMVILWLLSATAVVVLIWFHHQGEEQAHVLRAFGYSVGLSSGFYFALAGVSAIVLGAIVMQATLILNR